MNKRKRVAAHKHRAHIKKTKEKRRLALGPAGMAAEAARRRAPKKEAETGASEVKRKPLVAAEATHADKAAAVKEKTQKDHKTAKKTAEGSEVKPASENADAHVKKTKPAKAAVKPDKPEAAAEAPATAGEHHKARKPKTDTEA